MDHFGARLMELSMQSYGCSQILLLLRLEADGEENPGLVRAMGGLLGGMGFSGRLCGALTGGACLIGYYAAKGGPEERQDNRLNAMITELVEWFEVEYGKQYGGTDCACIMGGDLSNRMTRCPPIIEAVYFKCLEILEENGYELN